MELTSRLALHLLMSLPHRNFTLLLTDMERFGRNKSLSPYTRNKSHMQAKTACLRTTVTYSSLHTVQKEYQKKKKNPSVVVLSLTQYCVLVTSQLGLTFTKRWDLYQDPY